MGFGFHGTPYWVEIDVHRWLKQHIRSILFDFKTITRFFLLIAEFSKRFSRAYTELNARGVCESATIHLSHCGNNSV